MSEGLKLQDCKIVGPEADNVRRKDKTICSENGVKEMGKVCNEDSSNGVPCDDVGKPKDSQSGKASSNRKSTAANLKDEEHDNLDSMSDFSDAGKGGYASEDSTQRKLTSIEKRIATANLSKKERRLLQNRKSALKCRLKKQDQLSGFKGKLEKISAENVSLKEHVSIIFRL